MVADTAVALGCYREIAFIDDDPAQRGTQVLDFPVIGTSLDLTGDLADWDELFVAIGDNRLRADACRHVRSLGRRLATLRHPLAAVSGYASVSEGTLIMPRAVINAGTRIGGSCIVNTGAIVEHDCIIENEVHVSPGASIGGGSWLEEGVHVGMGAIVLPGVHICRRTVVGAGCVVRHDLPADAVAVGVPARIIRYKNHANSPFKPQHNGAGETRSARGTLDASSLARPQTS